MEMPHCSLTFLLNVEVLASLQERKVDWIVLAGFLRIIHPKLIKAYPNKIINIHPSLLPNYGGQGMYGMHVHNKVFENKEKESGITVHYVNEKLDDGNIILKKSFYISSHDNEKSLKFKTQKLEYLTFPEAIIKIFRRN